MAIEAVKGKIPHGTDNETSYVLEGFPKNKVQSLRLQKIGIVPDKFILLDVDEAHSIKKIKDTLQTSYQTPYQGDDLERVARESLAEYKMNIQGVVDSYDSFLY